MSLRGQAPRLPRGLRDQPHNQQYSPRPRQAARPWFVIQKHAASTLHYDFRLEVDGVLKSWAIPKGPSVDPRQKRLAVEVEDHGLDYFDFEGVLGQGYGAGTVIVWDWGRYRSLDPDRSVAEMIAAGHIKVWLEGEKLVGGWTLQRTRGGAKPQWLMIKRRDEGADARRRPQSTQPESVKTGRTIEELVRRLRVGEDGSDVHRPPFAGRPPVRPY